MKKNFLLRLFAILFATILPMSAFATGLDEYRLEQLQSGKEIVMDISLESAPGLMVNEAGEDWLSDLTKALLFNVRGNEERALIKVMLSGEPVLNITSQIAENGDVFLALDEIKSVFKVTGIQKAPKTAKSGAKNIKDLLKINLEDLQKFEPTGDKKLDAAVQDIIDNTKVEDVTEKNDNFDKAEKLVIQQLTNQDILNILKSDTFMNSMKSNSAVMPAQGNAEDIYEMYESGALTMEGIHKYYIDAENNLVAFEAPYKITVDSSKMPKKEMNESSEEKSDKKSNEKAADKPSGIKVIDATFNYYKKTGSPLIKHTITANTSIGDKKLLDFETVINEQEGKKAETAAKLVIANENDADSELALDINGIYNIGEGKDNGYYTIIVNKNKEDGRGFIVDFVSKLKDGAIVNNIGLALKTDLKKLEKSDTDVKLGTLKLVENYQDKMDIPSVDTKGAIDLEKMDQATQSKLTETMNQLFSAIVKKLPESVLNVIAPPIPVEEK